MAKEEQPAPDGFGPGWALTPARQDLGQQLLTARRAHLKGILRRRRRQPRPQLVFRQRRCSVGGAAPDFFAQGPEPALRGLRRGHAGKEVRASRITVVGLAYAEIVRMVGLAHLRPQAFVRE